MGKTALVRRLLKALEVGRLPDDLGELVVDGIVYLSPVGAHPVSFPNLFDDLCRLLPDDVAQRLRQHYRDPQEAPAGLMLALLEAFPGGRSVVLLDNFEDVIDAGTGTITDPALDEALRTLLAAPEHGIKVVITTRVASRDLLLTHPAAQRRLNLDEGLASPHAENILRAMDPDGSLGLKTAPDALLLRARDRTRGYPRALEALAAILATDRDTTLTELLTETERLPDNVVHALVGEAFTRLDPLAQQVMQALAVYTVPVPSVAVDYLLQPYRAAVDAAPVLTRLVNMQFVRRDAGRYYLHQVDRDYALHRVPLGGPADRDADPPPFTRYALQHRGADYFAQTRTPRETWKTLDDLLPQLAEFDLRYQSQDYHTAANVLHEINFDYLMLWCHYHLSIDMHQRLHGHLTDPWITNAHLTGLGNCYTALGQFPQAINHYQQALTIARDIGDRQHEAHFRYMLGDDVVDQGAWRASVEQYSQAIRIADEIGYALVQYEARVSLAQAYLLSGDLDACRAAAESATAHDYPPRRAQVHLLLGITQLRQGAHLQAQKSFTTAVGHADAQLQQTSDDYFTLECKALALCGLTLTDRPDQLPEAIALFRTARAITTAPGLVTRTLRLLDAITAHDTTGRLATARAAAQGDPG